MNSNHHNHISSSSINSSSSHNHNQNQSPTETKSVTSIKSGKSRNSAVLEKARAYNRIIEHKQQRESSSVSVNHSHHNTNNNSRSSGSPNNMVMTTTTTTTPPNIQGPSSSSQHLHGNSGGSAQSYNRHRGRGGGGVGGSASANTSTLQQSPSPQTSDKENYKSPRGGDTTAPYRTSNSSDKEPMAPITPQQQPQTKPQMQPSPQVQSQQQQTQGPNGAVTPELLVDALSGHEDGLLAIAERLMEHYEGGYDVMGEAIIDAFADVQKLFQHVVEAAHMEGAAYEAGRRDEELEQLRSQVRMSGSGGIMGSGGVGGNGDPSSQEHGGRGGSSKKEPGSPVRHDEFIDQDVRDILTVAIRNTFPLKEAQHALAYTVLEQACQSASALLPVDSDHRGRLQLSLARAESMPPGRACAILKYVMDDVLRSGLTVHSKVILPDPSQRGDCVLTPKGGARRGGEAQAEEEGEGGEENHTRQSVEEALASMVEEMKDILGAPMYDHSPLQSVSNRFWGALSETQRNHHRKEERLEQKLAMLKGDFLLAREEWEDKYNQLSRKSDQQTRTITKLQQQVYMEAAKQGVAAIGEDYPLEIPHPIGTLSSSLSNQDSHHGSPKQPPRASSSVGSFASLSQHAKSFVGSFSCGAGSAGRFDETEEETEGVTRRRKIDGSPPSVVSSSVSQGMTNGGIGARKGGLSFKSHGRR